jgi:hypothetical protein
VHNDLDYSRLKRSLEFFVTEYVPADLIATDSHPLWLLERDEKRSMTRARRCLSVAIGDFVEATQGYSIEHVLAADSELERRDAYTLSLLRSRFSRRRDKGLTKR